VIDAQCLCEKSQKPEIRFDALQLGAVTNRAVFVRGDRPAFCLADDPADGPPDAVGIICTAPLNNGVGETWSHANGICLARVR